MSDDIEISALFFDNIRAHYACICRKESDSLCLFFFSYFPCPFIVLATDTVLPSLSCLLVVVIASSAKLATISMDVNAVLRSDGNDLLAAGDVVKARKMYLRCLEVDPYDWKAMNNLSALEVEDNRPKEVQTLLSPCFRVVFACLLFSSCFRVIMFFQPAVCCR